MNQRHQKFPQGGALSATADTSDDSIFNPELDRAIEWIGRASVLFFIFWVGYRIYSGN